MPQKRSYGGEGRVRFRSPQVSGRRALPCPRCKALPGRPCFRSNSWVDDAGHPDKGFYTAIAKVLHPERRPAARPDTGPSVREQIGKISMRKLSGGERLAVRRWAGSIHRTPEELAARLAALEAMPDLPW